MAWRVARSLDTLLGQINGAAPSRSKISDGSIGDTAHSARTSDHNPDSRGIVHARDYTHDPARGADMHAIAASLTASADSRIKYLIWNRRITSWSGGRLGWVSYSGTNDHTKHMHVSVTTAGEDDTRPWSIGTQPLEDEVSAEQVWSHPVATKAGTKRAVDVLAGLDNDLRADLAWKGQQIADLNTKVDQLLQQAAQT